MLLSLTHTHNTHIDAGAIPATESRVKTCGMQMSKEREKQREKEIVDERESNDVDNSVQVTISGGLWLILCTKLQVQASDRKL